MLCNLGLDVLDSLLATDLGEPVLLGLCLPVVGSFPVGSIRVWEVGVLADLGVSLGVDLFKAVSLNTVVNVLLELRLVALFIVIL